MALLQVFAEQVECVARLVGPVLLSVDFCVLPPEEHWAVLTVFDVFL